MDCGSKQCRSVTYEFEVELDIQVPPPGAAPRDCPPLHDEGRGRKAREYIEARIEEVLRTLLPDVRTGCPGTDCYCKFDDPAAVTTFGYTLPRSTFTMLLDRVGPSEMPLDPEAECTYTVGGSVTVTRRTRRGSCAPTQEAVNKAFQD
ncbi:MAG: hypothetical protein P8188_03755 [Gemmatimonadota bacterium]